MKNPFKLKGFDTIIAAGLLINGSEITLGEGTTTVIDGTVNATRISGNGTLMVNGHVAADSIKVKSLIVTGFVQTNDLVVTDTLHLKKAAKLIADTASTAVLNVEPGGQLNATLKSSADLAVGDKVLLKNQPDPTRDGVHEVVATAA